MKTPSKRSYEVNLTPVETGLAVSGLFAWIKNNVSLSGQKPFEVACHAVLKLTLAVGLSRNDLEGTIRQEIGDIAWSAFASVAYPVSDPEFAVKPVLRPGESWFN